LLDRIVASTAATSPLRNSEFGWPTCAIVLAIENKVAVVYDAIQEVHSIRSPNIEQLNCKDLKYTTNGLRGASSIIVLVHARPGMRCEARVTPGVVPLSITL